MTNLDCRSYHRTNMKREMVINSLHDMGCRITKQRMILINIILEEDCSCPKEILYKASKIDNSIGKSTVYRILSLLEECGAIDRRNLYKIECDLHCCSEEKCIIKLDDNTVYNLNRSELNEVIKRGLISKGLISKQEISTIDLVGFK